MSRAIYLILLTALGLSLIWHVSVGAKPVPWPTVLEALTVSEPQSFDHVIIRNMRLPRAICAVLVGSSLAVAGALMQGITRNPLADPGVLGLLAGAAASVVVVSGAFGLGGPGLVPFIAAGGAFVASVLVWRIAAWADGGARPLTLVLSGAAVSAFLMAVVMMVNLLSEETFEAFRVWLTGTLSSQSEAVLPYVIGLFIVGMTLALLSARQVNALAMGEEAATGLGVNTRVALTSVLCAVIMLTAGAVALAGPMVFVGLVVPHGARLLFGHDYARLIPCSALCGAIFLLLADITGRLVLAPAEMSTGIITALVGAPIFIWLVRTRL